MIYIAKISYIKNRSKHGISIINVFRIAQLQKSVISTVDREYRAQMFLQLQLLQRVHRFYANIVHGLKYSKKLVTN